MPNQTMQRLLRQALRFGSHRRTEVCPPAMLGLSAAAASGWRAGLRDWLSTGWPVQACSGTVPSVGAVVADHRLEGVRDEFLQALDDVRTQQAGMLQGRLRIAWSLRELWHLRPEVFKLVALHFDQSEAQRRLDRLNRHFPTRSPRSGFAALETPSADGRPGRRG